MLPHEELPPAIEFDIDYKVKLRLTMMISKGPSNDGELARGWREFWRQTVRDLCASDELAVEFVDDRLGFPEPDWKYRAGRFPRKLYLSHPKYLNQEVRSASRVLETGEIEGGKGSWSVAEANAEYLSEFVSQLDKHPQVFHGEHFLVGLMYDEEIDTWKQGLTKEHPNVGPKPVLVAELTEFVASEGSIIATGKLKLAVGTISVAGAVALALGKAGLSDFASEQGAIVRIDKNLDKQKVYCHASGTFIYKRRYLYEQFSQRLNARSGSEVCETQAALSAVGYPVGPIDGRRGPMTDTAALAFASAWGLPASSVYTPVFFDALAKALVGERPNRP